MCSLIIIILHVRSSEQQFVTSGFMCYALNEGDKQNIKIAIKTYPCDKIARILLRLQIIRTNKLLKRISKFYAANDAPHERD